MFFLLNGAPLESPNLFWLPRKTRHFLLGCCLAGCFRFAWHFHSFLPSIAHTCNGLSFLTTKGRQQCLLGVLLKGYPQQKFAHIWWPPYCGWLRHPILGPPWLKPRWSLVFAEDHQKPGYLRCKILCIQSIKHVAGTPVLRAPICGGFECSG